MNYTIEEIITHFTFSGEFIHAEPFGCGHINDTFAIYFKHEFSRPVRYILQKINTGIFKDPDSLMKNIELTTNHIAKKIAIEGGDISREVMTLIRTIDGKTHYIDPHGNCFRAYLFVDDATAFQSIDNPLYFYKAGKAFGRFQQQLSDYDGAPLAETIPDFHNTAARFERFLEAVKDDCAGRAESVADEINFVMARREDASLLVDMLARGELPLRVTHNDTKLNNVLIDNESGHAVCVIDLDTVMPGLSLYDFGDSIRFGANTAAEDEKDLSKVSLSLELFEYFARGFLEEAGKALTPKEISLLPTGAKVMTLECGIRFLTDYLCGDTYFKTKYESHNLDRCRTQFKLVADMEAKMPDMEKIIADLI